MDDHTAINIDEFRYTFLYCISCATIALVSEAKEGLRRSTSDNGGTDTRAKDFVFRCTLCRKCKETSTSIFHSRDDGDKVMESLAGHALLDAKLISDSHVYKSAKAFVKNIVSSDLHLDVPQYSNRIEILDAKTLVHHDHNKVRVNAIKVAERPNKGLIILAYGTTNLP